MKILNKLIEHVINEFSDENQIETLRNIGVNNFNGKINGRFLNKNEVDDLQKEIESKYIQSGGNIFSTQFDDIRQNMWNYDYPILEKDVNGINLRVAEGLIRDKKKTYLLYANGSIIGEFYSLNDIKSIINNLGNL